MTRSPMQQCNAAVRIAARPVEATMHDPEPPIGEHPEPAWAVYLTGALCLAALILALVVIG